MAVVDQTLEFLLLVRSRLRHYEYPCEPGHYLPGWIYILIMDACRGQIRSEEHTSELQSLMRTSYAVFCLKKKNKHIIQSTELLKSRSYNLQTTQVLTHSSTEKRF